MKRKTIYDRAKEAGRLQSRQRAKVRRDRRKKAIQIAAVAYKNRVHDPGQSATILGFGLLQTESIIFSPQGGRPR